jgi:hypothetical protein
MIAESKSENWKRYLEEEEEMPDENPNEVLMKLIKS